MNTIGFQNTAVGAYSLWKSTGQENTAGEEAASRLTTAPPTLPSEEQQADLPLRETITLRWDM
jgi:hypothetical protein